MKNIYVKNIVEECNGELLIGNLEDTANSYGRDTRILNKDDIFVGIKGDTYNGNTLYKEAFLNGAKGCILDRDSEIDYEYIKTLEDKFIVLVDNTIDALGRIASYKRSLYDMPVVAITGSVGKTSTKDIVASVLGTKYNVLKTKENYNNFIGVPLTILSLKDEDIMVVEMGMNSLGEISSLSKITRPTLSLITNVGTAHIGNLGSRENILKAKLEILDGMEEKKLIINNDNDLLHEYYLNNKDNIITFGIDNESMYKAYNIEEDITGSKYNIDYNNNKYNVEVLVPGRHFVINSLAGIAVGNYFNIDMDNIKKGIKEFTLTKNRMSIDKINNTTLINDSYNANLDSMKMGINYLGKFNNKKIAVLGDMLELGEYSEDLHREVGKSLNDNNIDILITVGKLSKYINLEFNNTKYHFDNNEDAINKLKELDLNDSTILFKASNSMKFIDIYDFFKSYLEAE